MRRARVWLLLAVVLIQHWFLYQRRIENHRLAECATSLVESFNRVAAAFDQVKADNDKLLALNRQLVDALHAAAKR